MSNGEDFKSILEKLVEIQQNQTRILERQSKILDRISFQQPHSANMKDTWKQAGSFDTWEMPSRTTNASDIKSRIEEERRKATSKINEQRTQIEKRLLEANQNGN